MVALYMCHGIRQTQCGWLYFEPLGYGSSAGATKIPLSLPPIPEHKLNHALVQAWPPAYKLFSVFFIAVVARLNVILVGVAGYAYDT